jgi:hypothetical protein
MHWRGRVAEATARRLWPATVPAPSDGPSADAPEDDRPAAVMPSGSHAEAARRDP